jgi:3',5'-cyclic-AMP phosphodiesterase
MIVFAQVSDTHLDGGERRAGRLAAVMSYLNGQRLDAVVVTGDIADRGLPSEYEQARAIFGSSPHPVFPCPGNHDERAAFRQVMLGGDGDGDEDGDGGGDGGGDGAAAPVNRVYHAAGALFALCDSSIPGRSAGFLADETIGWLDGVLAEQPDRPAFVCCHHPPQLTWPYREELGQSGADRLAGLVARHPQVAGVLCGHAHTPAATTFAGRPLLVAPGVFSTLVVPWERGQILNEQAPPGAAIHILDDDQRLTTHYRVVS